MTKPSTVSISYQKVTEGHSDKIAFLGLNRPDSANAFNDAMLSEITAALQSISSEQGCRAMVLYGKGKHFSAGADLAWMKNSAELSLEENKKDASTLIKMFEALNQMPIPTIAVVKGAAFGGAVGLTACCDFAISYEDAKFCLSETKLGILPAVILPYLARKMRAGQLNRLGLTARVFSGIEALQFGLTEITATEKTIDEVLRSELNHILSCGPEALTRYKTLMTQTRTHSNQQGDYTVEAIAEARTSKEAQSGFKSFFAKQPSPWALALDENWTFDA